jgi:hypothetical protein
VFVSVVGLTLPSSHIEVGSRVGCVRSSGVASAVREPFERATPAQRNGDNAAREVERTITHDTAQNTAC